jgi:hypothetical protein
MTHQKTTQAIVVSGAAVNPKGQGVERISLYDGAGKPMQLNSSLAKVPAAITLTNVSSNVAIDASQGNYGVITLTASGWTIVNPTNPSNGQELTLGLRQDGTGSRTVTWGNKFDFGGVGGTPTLTTAASKLDFFKFIYDSTLDKWCCILKALNE